MDQNYFFVLHTYTYNVMKALTFNNSFLDLKARFLAPPLPTLSSDKQAVYLLHIEKKDFDVRRGGERKEARLGKKQKKPGTVHPRYAHYTVKKVTGIPSSDGMSLTKLSLAGKS